MENAILDAAVDQRLISKKQYQRIYDELLGDPGLDVGELLLSRNYITQEQLFQLQDQAGSEDVATGKFEAAPFPDSQQVGGMGFYQGNQGKVSNDAQKAMERLQSEEDSLANNDVELQRIYEEELNASRQESVSRTPPPTAQQQPNTPQQRPAAPAAGKATAPAPASPAAPVAHAQPKPPANAPAPQPPKATVSSDVAREALSKIKKLKDLLVLARNWGASDLHVCVDKPPFIRINGEIRYLEMPSLTAEFTEQLNFQLLSEEQREILCEKLNLDFALQLEGIGRHRCNVFHQRLGWNGVYRIIPNTIPSIDALGLPQICKDLTDHHQGLVLVTGPKGSGKSTSVAAMIDYVNRHRDDHVITVEDPIEYVHKPINCQMTMREMGNHSANFGMALRAALREDPDIILVGELRNHETISIALSAAETGHLVFGTLHTGGAARTVSRILDVYPQKQRDQITVMISESLRGIISQKLIPRADKKGTVLALEILVVNQGVSSIIKEGKMYQLISLMQAGKKAGMCTMDDSLTSLFKEGIISGKQAFMHSENKQPFEAFKDQD